MTQNEKRKSAERLFDNIGLIDDRFIAEADRAYVPGKRKFFLRSLIITAASLTLILSMLIGLIAAGMMASGLFSAGSSDERPAQDNDLGNVMDEVEDGGDDAEKYISLGEDLSRIKERSATLSADRDGIDLFDGKKLVIWKYADEETYRVLSISDTEMEALQSSLRRDQGTPINTDTAKANGLDGVWLSTGNGEIISPYLKQTENNSHYGEIFEYEPEYEPSAEFASLLYGIITERLK